MNEFRIIWCDYNDIRLMHAYSDISFMDGATYIVVLVSPFISFLLVEVNIDERGKITRIAAVVDSIRLAASSIFSIGCLYRDIVVRLCYSFSRTNHKHN